MVLLASDAFPKEGDRRTIEVQVVGADHSTIYLANYYGSKLYHVDTAIADAKGRVVFQSPRGYEAGVYAVVLPGSKYFEFVVNEPLIRLTSSSTNPQGDLLSVQSRENEIWIEYVRFFMEHRGEDPTSNAQSLIDRYPSTLAATIIRMSMPVSMSGLITKETDDKAAYYKYRKHFWDHFDLTDERLVRVPIFGNKLEEYFGKVVPQIPDTIVRLANELIRRTDSPAVFKYMVHTITNKYETSSTTGMDAVFAQMALTYYCPGSGKLSRATWMEEENLTKLCDRAREVDASYHRVTNRPGEIEASIETNVSFNRSKEPLEISRIAVVGLSGLTCERESSNDAALADMAAVPLSKHYVILERQNLSSVFDEAKFGMTGLVDEASATRVGSLLGAEGVVICKQTCFEGKTLFTMKLIECSTGKQAWAASGIDVKYAELLTEIVGKL